MGKARAAEGGALDGILVLLLSFAALAERAALLPFPLQLPVLAYLGHAEAVARAFLVGLPGGAPAGVATASGAGRAGDESLDRASRLAADFCMLARLLAAAIARLRCLSGLLCGAARHDAGPFPPSRAPAGPRALVPPRAPDTS